MKGWSCVRYSIVFFTLAVNKLKLTFQHELLLHVNFSSGQIKYVKYLSYAILRKHNFFTERKRLCFVFSVTLKFHFILLSLVAGKEELPCWPPPSLCHSSSSCFPFRLPPSLSLWPLTQLWHGWSYKVPLFLTYCWAQRRGICMSVGSTTCTR